MDNLKDRQENGDPSQAIAGDEQASGCDDETVGGPAEAANSQPADGVTEDEKKDIWLHDQQLNFNGAKNQLTMLAEALQKAIDLEKARLAQLVGARDAYKK